MERHQARYAKEQGSFRVERIASVASRFLACSDYRQGVARICCSNPDCRFEYFRRFSSPGFHPLGGPPHRLCPSCTQKRSLLFAEYLDEQLLLALPHRQFIFTLPKALRQLLGAVDDLVALVRGIVNPARDTTITVVAPTRRPR